MTRYSALIAATLLALSAPLHAIAQTDEALQIAVIRDDGAAIDAAIRAGSNPSALTAQGSMLAIAAMSGRARAVRVLLDHGADPSAPGPNGGSAIHAAFFAMNGVALLGRDELPDPGRRADAVEIVRMIAGRKSGLDTPVRIGPTTMTPLMQAAEAGAADVVQILLEAGANPNATNGGGYTALDYAVDRAPRWTALPQTRRVEIVRTLLARGARRDRSGADKVTPLERARRAGDPAIVAALQSG